MGKSKKDAMDEVEKSDNNNIEGIVKNKNKKKKRKDGDKEGNVKGHREAEPKRAALEAVETPGVEVTSMFAKHASSMKFKDGLACIKKDHQPSAEVAPAGRDQLRIAEVTTHSAQLGKVGPLLATFSHAPCSASLVAAAGPVCAVAAHWAGDWPAPSLGLAVDGLQYRSRAAAGRGLFTSFLAVRDRASGRTGLVEACPLVLEPRVVAPATRNPLLLAEAKKADTFEEKILEQKALIKGFGRKTGAKYFDERDAMKVDVSMTEKGMVRAAAAAAGGDTVVAVPAPGPTVEVVPPRHEGVGTREQVYRLEDLLSAPELRALGEAAQRFLEGPCNSKEALAELVTARQVSRLGAVLLAECLASSGSLGHRPAIVLYMEGVVRFTRLRPGERQKGPKSLQDFLPIVIKTKIFETFSCGRGRDSPELKDKAICYIMVLGLLAGKFQIETVHLSESVFVKSDHLKKLVAMVGAHQVSDSQKLAQFITLKLPLAKFDVNFSGGKKRRGAKS